MGVVTDLVLSGECVGEHELDKRFYVPGTSLTGKCGECGAGVEKDFAYDYLMYPITNKPKEVYLYCDECDAELGPVRVVVRIRLELAPAEPTASEEAPASCP